MAGEAEGNAPTVRYGARFPIPGPSAFYIPRGGEPQVVIENPAPQPGCIRAVCCCCTHGEHRAMTLPEGDLFVHAGDIAHHAINGKFALDGWREFKDWFSGKVRGLRASEGGEGAFSMGGLVVGGNHDHFAASNPVDLQQLFQNPPVSETKEGGGVRMYYLQDQPLLLPVSTEVLSRGDRQAGVVPEVLIYGSPFSMYRGARSSAFQVRPNPSSCGRYPMKGPPREDPLAVAGDEAEIVGRFLRYNLQSGDEEEEEEGETIVYRGQTDEAGASECEVCRRPGSGGVLDVLMTHTPCLGYGDARWGRGDGRSVQGSLYLLDYLRKAAPILHVCGDWHGVDDGNHGHGPKLLPTEDGLGRVRTINASCAVNGDKAGEKCLVHLPVLVDIPFCTCGGVEGKNQQKWDLVADWQRRMDVETLSGNTGWTSPYLKKHGSGCGPCGSASHSTPTCPKMMRELYYQMQRSTGTAAPGPKGPVTT